MEGIGTTDDTKLLASFIHGFSDKDSDKDEMIAAGSTVLNRIKSGKTEFGIDGNKPLTVHDVLYSDSSPYYEVNGDNERFNEAQNGKIASYNENSYKKALQIANGLLTGKIDPVSGEFIIRPSEIKQSGMDFDQLEKTQALKRYNIYRYKPPSKNKPNKELKTSDFKKAFAQARKSGKKIFEWNGEKFTTDLK